MLLLFDIGNTNTHIGLANAKRVVRRLDVPTSSWRAGVGQRQLQRFVGRVSVEGVALCSVVPRVTPLVRRAIRRLRAPGTGSVRKGIRQRAEAVLGAPFELTFKTLRGVGIDYPRPGTIGADRLANAVAARHHFGAPVLVAGFGTALTLDVVDARGNYVGGVIAPGLAAMTDYLHEKTALLPRVRVRKVDSTIGKSTEHAMLVGAVHGYRGLVRQLIAELKLEVKAKRLPVIATGGCARLIAAKVPEISAVEPDLTLEGLRLVWEAANAEKRSGASRSLDHENTQHSTSNAQHPRPA